MNKGLMIFFACSVGFICFAAFFSYKVEVMNWLKRQAAKMGMLTSPVNMVIFCPECGKQHIDAPDEAAGWLNPPHTSHLCHFCGVVFRLADIPTYGVQNTLTRGSRDTWVNMPTGTAIFTHQTSHTGEVKIDTVVVVKE